MCVFPDIHTDRHWEPTRAQNLHNFCAEIPNTCKKNTHTQGMRKETHSRAHYFVCYTMSHTKHVCTCVCASEHVYGRCQTLYATLFVMRIVRIHLYKSAMLWNIVYSKFTRGVHAPNVVWNAGSDKNCATTSFWRTTRCDRQDVQTVYTSYLWSHVKKGWRSGGETHIFTRSLFDTQMFAYTPIVSVVMHW